MLINPLRLAIRAALVWVLLAAPAIQAAAQSSAPPPVTVPPVSLILPNYNSVPLGEVAAIEGGAFVARADDSSSGYYNPAGLARAERSSISGSAGAYQFGSVSPEALTNVKGSFEQIPAMFAVLVKDLLGRPNWSGGFTVTRTAAWSQAVDAEAVSFSAERTNRFRFSTDAGYDAWLATVGVGYAHGDRLRVGATVDGQYTSIARRQSVTSQMVSNASLAATTVGAVGDVTATHLRATMGVQFAVAPAVHFGAVIRTPGLGVTAGGQGSLEALAHAGTATAASAFFDTDVSVHYRLPLEFKAGAAWIGTRAQVEADVLAYRGTGQYAAFESDEPVSVVIDAGQGGPVSVSQIGYQGMHVDSRAVVNVAIGGRYQLTRDRSWTLHAGYATDRSPVGDADTGFTKVHLQHVTVGLSGRTKIFLGSVGLRYSEGRSDPVGLGPLADGTSFATTFKVSSIGLVYSLALLF